MGAEESHFILTKALRKVTQDYRLKENDIRILWRSFQRWDDDDSGTIEDTEFLSYLDERPSFFTLEIFKSIDANSDGIMSFAEYIHASMKFGLLSKNEMLEFCFNIFLRGKGSRIAGHQLRQLVETIHTTTDKNKAEYEHVGAKSFNSSLNATIGLTLDRVARQQYFEMGEFRKLNRQYPQLLFPCFRIQRKMQRLSLGLQWFERRKEQDVCARLNKGPTLEQKMEVVVEKFKKLKERVLFCCCFGEPLIGSADTKVDAESKMGAKGKRTQPTRDGGMGSIFWHRDDDSIALTELSRSEQSACTAGARAVQPVEKMRVEELSSVDVVGLLRNKASKRSTARLKQARKNARLLENSRRKIKLENMSLYD